MSAVLLDTQVLIWWLLADRRLGRDPLTLISDCDDILVSVVSIYEIDFKRRDPTRLRSTDDLLRAMPADMSRSLPALGMKLLPVDAATAWRAANLPFDHGDPWDRILVAQALELGVTLVSADAALKRQTKGYPATKGLIVF